MKLLLDTHTFLWMDSQPDKLPLLVQEICRDPKNVILLSFVIVWEIQIKWQIGKLQLNQSLKQKIRSQQNSNQLQLLPITLEHIFALNDLPLHHRDPFDRLLIAQARVEGATLLSKDGAFEDYEVPLIWHRLPR